MSFQIFRGSTATFKHLVKLVLFVAKYLEMSTYFQKIPYEWPRFLKNYP